MQGDADLARLKREAGDWLAFWGGINAAVTLTRGTDEEIRRAVETAVGTLGPGGGFVLLPVDTLCEDVPAHALDVLIAGIALSSRADRVITRDRDFLEIAKISDLTVTVY